MKIANKQMLKTPNNSDYPSSAVTYISAVCKPITSLQGIAVRNNINRRWHRINLRNTSDIFAHIQTVTVINHSSCH